MTAASPPIRRADVMSWAKVVAIVAPIMATVIAASVKLSVDSAELHRDVAELQSRVAEHASVLRDYNTIMPKLALIASQLDSVVRGDNESRQRFTALEARLDAQNKATERFWATTWPALEGRLSRIETLLDRRR